MRRCKVAIRLAVLLIVVRIVNSSCTKHCNRCDDKRCFECATGYGLTEDKTECLACRLQNCQSCQGDAFKCEVCAEFHFLQITRDPKNPYNCSKCGAGCKQCLDENKCTRCGPLFKFQEEDTNICISDSKAFYLLLLAIMIFLLLAVSFAFWCTNMTASQRRALIEKLKRKKEEEEREAEGEEAADPAQIVESEVAELQEQERRPDMFDEHEKRERENGRIGGGENSQSAIGFNQMVKPLPPQKLNRLMFKHQQQQTRSPRNMDLKDSLSSSDSGKRKSKFGKNQNS